MFPNLAAQSHVNKGSFRRKFTLNEKCGCLILSKRYQQIQKILRYAYGMALVFFKCPQGVGFEAKYELPLRYLEYNISGSTCRHCELHEKIQIKA